MAAGLPSATTRQSVSGPFYPRPEVIGMGLER